MQPLHRWLSDLLNVFFPKGEDGKALWPWGQLVLVLGFLVLCLAALA